MTICTQRLEITNLIVGVISVDMINVKLARVFGYEAAFHALVFFMLTIITPIPAHPIILGTN